MAMAAFIMGRRMMQCYFRAMLPIGIFLVSG